MHRHHAFAPIVHVRLRLRLEPIAMRRCILATSTNSLYDWERSSAELWDRKLQLERELKAVEEQQTELLGNHVVRMNDLMFKREPL